jgi:hypothetical protein
MAIQDDAGTCHVAFLACRYIKITASGLNSLACMSLSMSERRWRCWPPQQRVNQTARFRARNDHIDAESVPAAQASDTASLGSARASD